jgi:RNA polymerase sigma-70 factor (ECF subfamily)
VIGNTEHFARLYEETHLIVFRYAYGLSGGPRQEAEDLTAETFARAWKARQQFRGDSQAALGWLLRIARNLAIDLSRRRRVRDVKEDVDVDSLLGPASVEMDVERREQIVVLWRMLQTLTADVREMLVLRYMLGWQVRQIATHLEMNENTVTVTMQRAIKGLQRDWPPQENDHD